MSTLSGGGSVRESRTPSPPADSTRHTRSVPASRQTDRPSSPTERFPEFPTSVARTEYAGPVVGNDPNSTARTGRQRSSSRPVSMIQTYQPPVMDTQDTIPELLPAFTLLNSHANKLYQEGYFLKLDDQNSQGRPNPDRNWTECFAQLVGTVLSLWDAAELDAVGPNGEVIPKFINLTDASLKVIDSLPTRSTTERPLQNVLSVSTAGRNRYLLHFNSHHSLIQWTSAFRLAIYEHSTLQEAYTGALVAGKGRTLNNINLIMGHSKFKTEQWVRVRFGAGVPWRLCWCVVSPPDEKEVTKLQKDLKKRSKYDRSHAPILQGTIKFYETRKEGKKQKKAKPVATITNAYSAYAIYPQSKALIDASSLVKLEGTIVIHSDPPSTTEGFLFMMPEVPNAVSGFEMLLRFLFPIWDAFALYGRPNRLVASTLDPRSLMFAMPKNRRHGYLELLDVSTLVLTDGSASWTEREWRKRLKDLTAKRLAVMDESSSSGYASSRNSRSNSKRLSFGPGSVNSTNSFPTSVSMGAIGEGLSLPRQRVGFAGHNESRPSRSAMSGPTPAMRNGSAPPTSNRQRTPSSLAQSGAFARARNNSDADMESAAPPYAADAAYDAAAGSFPELSSSAHMRGFVNELTTTPERVSSEDDFSSSRNATPPQDLRDMHQDLPTPEPVTTPPAMHHPPSSRPAASLVYQSAELRRQNSRLSNTTLAQIVGSRESLPMPDMNNAQGSRPNSRGSSKEVPAGMPMSSSTSTPALASPGQLHPQPSIAPHLAYSKSPLNQAHNALPQAPESAQPVDGSAHATGPPPTEPLVPSSAHTGHMPSHMHDTENGRQILLVQGPAPPSFPENAPSPSPVPYRRIPYQMQPLPASSSTSQRALPPQPGRLRTPPPTAGPAPGAQPLSPIITSPISRKPVPTSADSVQGYKEVAEPQSAQSSTGSLPGYLVDEDALLRIQQNSTEEEDADAYVPQRAQEVHPDRNWSEASSNYDDNDNASTTSPDYASTHESVHTQESVERPRAGVLRTVGDTSAGVPQPQEDLHIPEVNFGPTYNYAAANLPQNKTPTPLSGPGSGTRAISLSPGGSSAVAAATAAMMAATASPSGPAKTRKASRDLTQRTPENAHRRQDSDDTIRRRSVAWQPGGSMLGPSASGDARPAAPTLTPEQFVLQRAQVSPSAYVHQRAPSNNSMLNVRKNTPSPSVDAMRRRSSYDMLSGALPLFQQQQRPSSQGASAALGSHARSTSYAEVGTQLSAREQEHLARLTGSPLINMASNGRRDEVASSPGLVGAIAAREREKQQMLEGVSSQAVQHAIIQRQSMQYQQQQQQQLAQQQAQHNYFMQQQQMQMQMQQQQMQQQQQQYAQMYTAANPSVYGDYQLPAGHSRTRSRSPMGFPMASPAISYESPPLGMAGGWPAAQPQQQQQQYPQQQYAQSQMSSAPRARTPSTSGLLYQQPGRT